MPKLGIPKICPQNRYAHLKSALDWPLVVNDYVAAILLLLLFLLLSSLLLLCSSLLPLDYKYHFPYYKCHQQYCSVIVVVNVLHMLLMLILLSVSLFMLIYCYYLLFY